MEDRLSRRGPRRRPGIDLKYLYYGFAYLQDMVEHAVIAQHAGRNITDIPGISVQQMPYPCYIEDRSVKIPIIAVFVVIVIVMIIIVVIAIGIVIVILILIIFIVRFIIAIARTFPLFMTLAWVYSASMIIKSIFHEKEMRLKETMRVMGLGNGVHWVSWFLDSFAMMFTSCVLLTIILVVSSSSKLYFWATFGYFFHDHHSHIFLTLREKITFSWKSLLLRKRETAPTLKADEGKEDRNRTSASLSAVK